MSGTTRLHVGRQAVPAQVVGDARIEIGGHARNSTWRRSSGTTTTSPCALARWRRSPPARVLRDGGARSAGRRHGDAVGRRRSRAATRRRRCRRRPSSTDALDVGRAGNPSAGAAIERPAARPRRRPRRCADSRPACRRRGTPRGEPHARRCAGRRGDQPRIQRHSAFRPRHRRRDGGERARARPPARR